jgi:hypothetical protein
MAYLSRMLTHRDVIQLLGGPTAVAKALGLNAVNTTVHWATRGVPRKYQRRISEMAEGKGVKITWADWERLTPSGSSPSSSSVEAARAA